MMALGMRSDTPPKTATCCQCLLLSDFFSAAHPGKLSSKLSWKCWQVGWPSWKSPTRSNQWHNFFSYVLWTPLKCQTLFRTTELICSKMLKRNLRNKELFQYRCKSGKLSRPPCCVRTPFQQTMPRVAKRLWLSSLATKWPCALLLESSKKQKEVFKKNKSPWHPVDVWMDGRTDRRTDAWTCTVCMHACMYTCIRIGM